LAYYEKRSKFKGKAHPAQSLLRLLVKVNHVEKGEKTYKQAQKNYGIQERSTVLFG